MAAWNPALALPSQLADAFAAMFDWFRLEYFTVADNQGWITEARKDSFVQDILIPSVESTDWAVPQEILDFVQRSGELNDEKEMAKSIYFALNAIDRGVARIMPGPSVSRSPSGLAMGLHRFYVSRGHYNTDTSEGYVLPKRTKRYRGDNLNSHFVSWMRAHVDPAKVHLIGRGTGASALSWTGSPRIGIVPLLYHIEDAAFRGIEIDGQPHFAVVHEPSRYGDLAGRIKGAVEAIREQAVNVALFPELVLNEHLLGVLKSELRASEPEDSPLSWVIAGATRDRGPEDDYPIYNVVHVLDSVGSPIEFRDHKKIVRSWCQVKRHRYMMTIKEQKRYRLLDMFGEHHDRKEAINIGDHVFVFDGDEGRSAVVICEDWSQEEETCGYLRALDCRVIFVVIMDGATVEGRWAPHKAHDFAEQTGAHVVIANSLLLANRQEPRPPRVGEDPPCKVGFEPVGLLISPPPDVDREAPRSKTLCAAKIPTGDRRSALSNVIALDLTS